MAQPSIVGTPVRGLLLNGTSGAGKSTIAAEVWERLVGRSPGSAFIDLDAIAKCDTGQSDDFYGSALMEENLASMWPNYQRREVTTLVLARAVPDRAELNRLHSAVPDIDLTVVLLVSDEVTLAHRLARRDLGQLAGRRLKGAVELQTIMLASGIAHAVIENNLDSDLIDVTDRVLDSW